MIYPPKLSLVNLVAYNAYVMTFLKERILEKDLDILENSVPPIQFEMYVDCDFMQAYYLAGFRLKASGGPMPEGRLHVMVDGDRIVDEDVATNLSSGNVPWLKPKHPRCLFLAVPYEEDRIGNKLLGFFLPNGSLIRVGLDIKAPLPKSTSIKVEMLGAMYESAVGSNTIPLPPGVADL